MSRRLETPASTESPGFRARTNVTRAKPFLSGRRAVRVRVNVTNPSSPVACSATVWMRLYGTRTRYTRAPRTTNPRVSVTRKGAVNGLRERTGFGVNETYEIYEPLGQRDARHGDRHLPV